MQTDLPNTLSLQNGATAVDGDGKHIVSIGKADVHRLEQRSNYATVFTEMIERYNAHQDLVTTARALVEAYESGYESVEWDDLDLAYDKAKRALDEHNFE